MENNNQQQQNEKKKQVHFKEEVSADSDNDDAIEEEESKDSVDMQKQDQLSSPTYLNTSYQKQIKQSSEVTSKPKLYKKRCSDGIVKQGFPDQLFALNQSSSIAGRRRNIDTTQQQIFYSQNNSPMMPDSKRQSAIVSKNQRIYSARNSLLLSLNSQTIDFQQQIQNSFLQKIKQGHKQKIGSWLPEGDALFTIKKQRYCEIKDWADKRQNIVNNFSSILTNLINKSYSLLNDTCQLFTHLSIFYHDLAQFYRKQANFIQQKFADPSSSSFFSFGSSINQASHSSGISHTASQILKKQKSIVYSKIIKELEATQVSQEKNCLAFAEFIEKEALAKLINPFFQKIQQQIKEFKDKIWIVHIQLQNDERDVQNKFQKYQASFQELARAQLQKSKKTSSQTDLYLHELHFVNQAYKHYFAMKKLGIDISKNVIKNVQELLCDSLQCQKELLSFSITNSQQILGTSKISKSLFEKIHSPMMKQGNNDNQLLIQSSNNGILQQKENVDSSNIGNIKQIQIQQPKIEFQQSSQDNSQQKEQGKEQDLQGQEQTQNENHQYQDEIQQPQEENKEIAKQKQEDQMKDIIVNAVDLEYFLPPQEINFIKLQIGINKDVPLNLDHVKIYVDQFVLADFTEEQQAIINFVKAKRQLAKNSQRWIDCAVIITLDGNIIIGQNSTEAILTQGDSNEIGGKDQQILNDEPEKQIINEIVNFIQGENCRWFYIKEEGTLKIIESKKVFLFSTKVCHTFKVNSSEESKINDILLNFK